MPNRVIKESITTSENLDNLTAEEERFFLRLTVKVDDFGRFDARPAILRSACFPLKTDKIKLKDIEIWLAALVREELVKIYLVKDRPYLYLITWADHQRVRASKSKYPDPSEDSADICGHLPASDTNGEQTQTDVPVNVNGNENDNGNENGSGEKFGKHVTLTPEEYASLITYMGDNEQTVKDYIEDLNIYVDKIGIKKFNANYKSQYATLQSWYRRDKKQEQTKPRAAPSRSQQIIDLVKSVQEDKS